MPSIKLSDIVIDPTIQVREISTNTVSEYRQALRAGAKFPPLIIEKGTNRVVCGNHRYYAFKGVLAPDAAVNCTYETFKSEADLIKRAASDNSKHGRPLSTWDKKRVVMRLGDQGVDKDEIAAVLSVPINKVEEWAGMTVVVVGGTSKKQMRRSEPVKHGLEHMAGKEIPETQYEEHADRDRGVPAKNLAASLTRWINNGWIDTDDDKTMANLQALYDALGGLLSRGKRKTG